MRIKVAKFGGSSVADVIQCSKVKEIVLGDPARRAVVVSAPGRRFEQDIKITDLLYLCHTHIEHNLPWEQLFQVVCDRFSAMAMSLGVDPDELSLAEEFEKIRREMNKGGDADYIASRGEYLNALLIAKYIGYDFADAADIIKFDERGHLLSEETDEAVRAVFEGGRKVLVPGFYGSMPDGRIKTFSRGGSDITGAIIARALGAEVYENWTDVHGFLTADPAIVEKPEPIEIITYEELRELSYMGANVLHEDAIFPVREAKIPINIRNTNDPGHAGTTITADSEGRPEDRIVTGIAGSRDFIVIGILKHHFKQERGFVRRLLGILEDYDLIFEHIPTGIDNLSVVLSKKKLGDNLEEIIEKIEMNLQPDRIEVSDEIALIATVGLGMSWRKGVSAALFTALAEGDVNVRMIDQGSSEMNIIVGVEKKDFEKAIRAIYGAFFEKKD